MINVPIDADFNNDTVLKFIEDAEAGERVIIYRDGKPIAAIIGVNDLNALTDQIPNSPPSSPHLNS